MNKLGVGFSYKVYNLDERRVIKKPVSNIYKFLKLFIWNLGSISLAKDSIYNQTKKSKMISKTSILNLKTRLSKIDTKLIGNPKIEENLTYTQDKVKIVRDYLQENLLDDNKKLINNYIKLFFKTWSQGFSDTVFNFTINYGLNKDSKLTLIDLDELTFSKDEIKNLIIDKEWLKQWSYRHNLKDENLKLYYKEQMNKHLTITNLNNYWGNSQNQKQFKL